MEDSAAAPATGTPAELALSVILRAEGSSWIEVSAEGEEPQRQELQPGQTLELRARQRLGLALGDAGVVRISVNGRDLGYIGDKGEVRRGLLFEAPMKTAGPGGAAGGR